MPRDYLPTDGTTWSVFLNGRLLDDVRWADEAAGEAELYEHEWRLDQRGARIQDDTPGSGYRTLIVRGKILVIKHPPPDQTSFDYGCGEMGWCPG